MGILGIQVVFSLIAFSFLQKLSRYFSFGMWMISGRLVQYLYPSDQQLRAATGLLSSNSQKRKKTHDFTRNGTNNSFTVPKNVPIDLDSAPLNDVDIVVMKFYADYQWLVDYSLCSLLVFIFTDVAYFFGLIHVEYNLSTLWSVLVIFFCIRILLWQFNIYIKTEEGGERILCFVFTFTFLILAMAALIVDEEYLEFGLQAGYQNFSENAQIFMTQHSYIDRKPFSATSFKIVLAFMSAMIGAFVTFPGLRFSKMYLDSLLYGSDRRFYQMLLHLNFIAPLCFILLWVKPIGREIFCRKRIAGRDGSLMSDGTFELARIVVGISGCILRFSLLVPHLQSHLNLAHERLQRLKKENGRIVASDLQKMVARVSYYLCVVAIQYVAPTLLVLFSLLLLKSLGGYSWVELLPIWLRSQIAHYPPATSNSSVQSYLFSFNGSEEISAVLGNVRHIFSETWYRGLLSFISWWTSSALFASSLLGVFYYSRFPT